ncbi:hypothetical protein CDAR_39841 [Caerostris darwini]|uniref:Uncharacterized protein n=1 Tax=Caerostris darwini TaxID=1538125 RepID=A0AAV4SSV5_9ARAC|nr:hypothetical protein CDAR_39841 [Caerostris darwini]
MSIQVRAFHPLTYYLLLFEAGSISIQTQINDLHQIPLLTISCYDPMLPTQIQNQHPNSNLKSISPQLQKSQSGRNIPSINLSEGLYSTRTNTILIHLTSLTLSFDFHPKNDINLIFLPTSTPKGLRIALSVRQ